MVAGGAVMPRVSATPQPGIIPEPSESALFLILRVRDPVPNAAAVAQSLSRVPALVAKVGAIDPKAKLVCTVAIGPEYWDVLVPGKRPKGLRPFRAIAGKAPNTGGDLLVHVISRRPDLNFELARRIMGELKDHVEVMDEVHGFRYLDSRDLTGFIDGTENPVRSRASR